MRIRSAIFALIAVAAMATGGSPYAAPNEGHAHPTDDSVGGLPTTAKNVEMVGNVHLTDIENGIGDVTALGNYAYVAAYAAECYNPSPTSPRGGVHIVDFSIPQSPQKVGFISAGANTYVGEGVHAMRIKTSKFTGDVLLFSTESCSRGKKANGGISLYDITDPVNPKPLAIGVGDNTPRIKNLSAHTSHSAMMWQAGSKAYAVLQDNHEGLDVDIMDITDPRKPKMIAETGRSKFKGLKSQSAMGTFPGSFHHDMMVKKISGHWVMLVSYWDTGWVTLNIDNPKKPKYINDFNYPKKDPLTKRAPEGNAHQGVWSSDNKYIIGTDEDFFAKYTILSLGSTEISQGSFFSGQSFQGYEWAYGAGIRSKYGFLDGPSLYVGTGCPLLQAMPDSGKAGKVARGQEVTAVMVEGGGCSYDDKVKAAQDAGFDAVVMGSSHDRTNYGTQPSKVECTEANGTVSVKIPVVCVSHVNFHRIVGTKAEFGIQGDPGLVVGKKLQKLNGFGLWDGGWGSVHLLNAKTMKQVGQYAIPESLKERYGDTSGFLSVHETKTDPRKGVNLAYASWYGGGLRVLKFGSKGITEAGRWVNEGGSNIWGVFPIFQELHTPAGEVEHPTETEPLILLSDMAHGLYIVRYTGPR